MAPCPSRIVAVTAAVLLQLRFGAEGAVLLRGSEVKAAEPAEVDPNTEAMAALAKGQVQDASTDSADAADDAKAEEGEEDDGAAATVADDSADGEDAGESLLQKARDTEVEDEQMDDDDSTGSAEEDDGDDDAMLNGGEVAEDEQIGDDGAESMGSDENGLRLGDSFLQRARDVEVEDEQMDDDDSTGSAEEDDDDDDAMLNGGEVADDEQIGDDAPESTGSDENGEPLM